MHGGDTRKVASPRSGAGGECRGLGLDEVSSVGATAVANPWSHWSGPTEAGVGQDPVVGRCHSCSFFDRNRVLVLGIEVS